MGVPFIATAGLALHIDGIIESNGLPANLSAPRGARAYNSAIVSTGASAPSTPGPQSLVAGKYRVDRVLGEGGMGVVVAATHEQLDQRYALKFLLPALADQPGLVERFMREARAAAKIQSEHVARVLDVGVHEGTPYMVMEYLEGGDLAALLTKGPPLSARDAVGYLLEAAEAIAEAHSLGIIHRDLKPANLFLARRPNGRAIVKVLDFGISKARSTKKDAVLTHAATIVGSPSYMSPEQLVSAASVDVRSDVWSLGVVLYEMLSRKLPFEADTMPELVGMILQKKPDSLAVVQPDVPEGLTAVVDRCLEKDPAKRFASVAALATALLPFAPPQGQLSVERIRHVLAQSTPSLRPPPDDLPSAPVVLAGTRPVGALTFSPTTSAAPEGGRRRLLIVGPLLAAVLVAGAVLAFVSRGSKSSSPSTASAVPPTLPIATTAIASPPARTASEPVPSASEPAPSASAPVLANDDVPSPPKPAKAPSRAGKSASAHPAPSVLPSGTASAPAPTCALVPHVTENGDTYFTKECH